MKKYNNWVALLLKQKTIFILTVLSLCFCLAKGQKIDSLKSLLNEKSGLERCDILYQIAYEYVDFDNALGLQYATEAFKVAREYDDSLRIVKAGRIKSLAFRRLGKIDSALILSIEILPMAKRNNYIDELKHILNGLAALYAVKAFYDKALKCHLESLELREKYGNKFEVSVTLNNIGFVYYKMKDYDKALSYYKQSLKLKTETHDNSSLDLLLLNISLCYAHKNNFPKARSFVDQALSLCKEKKCSDSSLPNIYYNLGVISFGLKDYSDAKTQFSKSFILSKKQDNKRLQLDNIVYLSQIYVQRNQLVLAQTI